MEDQLRSVLKFNKFLACNLADAGPSGRAIYGVGLRPLAC